MSKPWITRVPQRLQITRRWLALASILICGWVWTLFAAQYRYPLLQDPNTNKRFFLLTFLLTIGFTAACLKITPRKPEGRKLYKLLIESVAMGIGWFVAIFGLLLTANALLDSSPVMIHQSVVIDTLVKNGRSTRYLIILKSWRPGEEAYAVSLSRSQYLRSNLKPGERVAISIGSGTLGFPWIVSLEKSSETQ